MNGGGDRAITVDQFGDEGCGDRQEQSDEKFLGSEMGGIVWSGLGSIAFGFTGDHAWLFSQEIQPKQRMVLKHGIHLVN